MRTLLFLLLTALSAQAGSVVTELKSGDLVDTRVDRLPAIYVPEGESPSPFLPAGPFKASWTTRLKIAARQDFTFELRGAGERTLTIDGQEVVGEPVTLSQGEPARRA